jgi:hypothetical protein
MADEVAEPDVTRLPSGTYRQKQTEIEAWQWNIAPSAADTPAWVVQALLNGLIIRRYDQPFLQVFEDDVQRLVVAQIGDWITTSGGGFLRVIKAGDFSARFEYADPQV